ncbi:TniQ family protein [Bradyrhizobium sp. WYCCWR 13022]|uniref:TniQ family protein n=1 Tax=unclassified Bradyrhizobium TaxID=2631580 RepID=UPI00263B87BF|nr:TniQ family protein [Bradyrhizobium sp. WYCCWR 13022]MDN4982174.1 TniQ family protein [Bradyrhizobium sp. WYCCWR 13022]
MKSRGTKFAPLPGESLPSLLLRAASTLTPSPQHVVHDLLGNPEHLASAATRIDRMKELADYLNVAPSELIPTMLVPDDNRPHHVRLGDFVFRWDQVRQTPVRFAFDILRKDEHPYHRLVWSVCALRRDPDTGTPLEDRCAFCSEHFRWSAASALARCHGCGGEATRMTARPKVSDDAKAVFCAKLLSSSVRQRTEFRRSLPDDMATWAEADLLEMADALCDLGPSSAEEGDALNALYTGQGAIASLLAGRLSELRRQAPRMSSLVAFANLAVRINRLYSLRVRKRLALVLERL